MPPEVEEVNIYEKYFFLFLPQEHSKIMWFHSWKASRCGCFWAFWKQGRRWEEEKIHHILDNSIVLTGVGIITFFIIVASILLLLISSNSDYEAVPMVRSDVRGMMLSGVNKREVKVLGDGGKSKRYFNSLFYDNGILKAWEKKVGVEFKRKNEKRTFVSGVQQRESRCKCS